MAAKMCNVCGTRRVGSGGKRYDVQSAAAIGLCGPCDEEGGWENTHSDEGHDNYGPDSPAGDEQPFMAGCWICHPELNEAKRPVKAGSTKGHNSPRRKQLNHRTQCKHPQTPAARRACREAHWAEQAEI